MLPLIILSPEGEREDGGKHGEGWEAAGNGVKDAWVVGAGFVSYVTHLLAPLIVRAVGEGTETRHGRKERVMGDKSLGINFQSPRFTSRNLLPIHSASERRERVKYERETGVK